MMNDDDDVDVKDNGQDILFLYETYLDCTLLRTQQWRGSETQALNSHTFPWKTIGKVRPRSRRPAL